MPARRSQPAPQLLCEGRLPKGAAGTLDLQLDRLLRHRAELCEEAATWPDAQAMAMASAAHNGESEAWLTEVRSAGVGTAPDREE